MKWLKSEIDPQLVRSISRRYGVDLLAASIYARRGVTEPGQLLYYLEDDFALLRNPFLFDRMEDAVDRILQAREEGEKVLVFGDGDTDGISGTVILVEALSAAGLDVSWRVPVGDEAYGLSAAAVREFATAGGRLIVTVDCGISNHEEVTLAAELGIDVIIADHHRLQAPEPPEALAVINPKLPDSGYPFRDLAGCGVAFKLACALAFAASGLYKQQIALLDFSRVEGEPAGETGALAGASAGSGASAGAGYGERAARPTYRIDAVKLHNLVPGARLSLKLAAGDGQIAAERLSRFLGDRQIFVWDARTQRALASEIFGQAVDIHFYDLAPDAARGSPALAGRSLRDLAADSRLARYRDDSAEGTVELSVFQQLFSGFALERAGLTEAALGDLLQMAALGTVADMMPLKDENRIIVARGLRAVNRAPRKGLREILDLLEIRGRPLGSHEISWQVTPVINASGRMGTPDLAVGLFLGDDEGARRGAAARIGEMNQERRKLGSEAWDSIIPLARESCEKHGERFVLVGSDSVAPGITGLIASRVTAALKVPTVIASFRKEGEVVGSIRTARGFPVTGLLESCAELFIDYGGHDAAAGFSMRADRWDEFARRAGEYMAGAEIDRSEESIAIDAELPHDFMAPAIAKLAERFEPYGEENRPLVLMARNVPMADAQIVGKNGKSHLKLTLDFGAYKWPALMWDGGERLERDFSFRNRDRLDVLFKITSARWNGEERPQLELYDLRRAAERTGTDRRTGID